MPWQHVGGACAGVCGLRGGWRAPAAVFFVMVAVTTTERGTRTMASWSRGRGGAEGWEIKRTNGIISWRQPRRMADTRWRWSKRMRLRGGDVEPNDEDAEQANGSLNLESERKESGMGMGMGSTTAKNTETHTARGMDTYDAISRHSPMVSQSAQSVYSGKSAPSVSEDGPIIEKTPAHEEMLLSESDSVPPSDAVLAASRDPPAEFSGNNQTTPADMPRSKDRNEYRVEGDENIKRKRQEDQEENRMQKSTSKDRKEERKKNKNGYGSGDDTDEDYQGKRSRLRKRDCSDEHRTRYKSSKARRRRRDKSVNSRKGENRWRTRDYSREKSRKRSRRDDPRKKKLARERSTSDSRKRREDNRGEERIRNSWRARGRDRHSSAGGIARQERHKSGGSTNRRPSRSNSYTYSYSYTYTETECESRPRYRRDRSSGKNRGWEKRMRNRDHSRPAKKRDTTAPSFRPIRNTKVRGMDGKRIGASEHQNGPRVNITELEMLDPSIKRKVHVQGFGPKTREIDLRMVFDPCGNIKDVFMSRKGLFSFIEFEKEEEAEIAIREKYGQILPDGTRITVQLAKPRMRTKNTPTNELFVGSLPDTVEERDVIDLMETHGDVTGVLLKKSPLPGTNSYAFVRFATVEDATRALRAREYKIYKGSLIRIDYASGQRKRRYPPHWAYREQTGTVLNY